MNGHTITPHDREWAQLPDRIESRHAYVILTRDQHRCELAGGRHRADPTWHATLRLCDCDQPACRSAGRIAGYRPPGWTPRSDQGARTYGRQHPDVCRDHNRCHGRYGDGYAPADVVAIAEGALATWRPASRTPQSPRFP